MRVFKEFPKEDVCPICGKNTNKECVLIGINGTQEEGNMEARCYHLDCLELTEYDKGEELIITQQFKKRDE